MRRTGEEQSKKVPTWLLQDDRRTHHSGAAMWRAAWGPGRGCGAGREFGEEEMRVRRDEVQDGESRNGFWEQELRLDFSISVRFKETWTKEATWETEKHVGRCLTSSVAGRCKLKP